MAWIKDINQVEKVMEANKFVCWKVFDLQSPRSIYGLSEDESISPKKAFSDLMDCLNSISGQVGIRIFAQKAAKGGDTSKDFTYNYICGDHQAGNSAAIKNGPINGINSLDGFPSIYQLITENNQLKMEKEIAKLRQELSPEKTSSTESAMKLRLFNKIMDKLDGKEGGTVNETQQKPATGTQNSGPHHVKEKQDRAINALKDLGKIDQDIDLKLEKLAKIAKENPDLFATLLQSLEAF